MSVDFTDDVPAALRAVRTRPLFVMRLAVKPILTVGAAPGGIRRVGLVEGGAFAGARISGRVLDGGNDWQGVRADGSTTLDVRLVLEVDSGALIAMTYRGLRHGPPGVLERLERGDAVEPDQFYFRIAPSFETAAADLAWLNHVQAIGIGHRDAQGVLYSVFEVL